MWRTVSLQLWLFSVSETLLNPKLEGLKAEKKEGQKRDMEQKDAIQPFKVL